MSSDGTQVVVEKVTKMLDLGVEVIKLTEQLSAQCALTAQLQKQVDHFWEYVSRGWEIEGREYFETTYGDLALYYAAHYMWKRDIVTKCPKPEPKQLRSKYITLGLIPLEEGFRYIQDAIDNSSNAIVTLYEKPVNVRGKSRRLRTFLEKGVKCACCGREGQFFSVDRQKNAGDTRYHLNLWGVYNEQYLLFTHDHIVPRSAGGENKVSNCQTMCVDCNQAKGATVPIQKD